MVKWIKLVELFRPSNTFHMFNKLFSGSVFFAFSSSLNGARSSSFKNQLSYLVCARCFWSFPMHKHKYIQREKSLNCFWVGGCLAGWLAADGFVCVWEWAKTSVINRRWAYIIEKCAHLSTQTMHTCRLFILLNYTSIQTIQGERCLAQRISITVCEIGAH